MWRCGRCGAQMPSGLIWGSLGDCPGSCQSLSDALQGGLLITVRVPSFAAVFATAQVPFRVFKDSLITLGSVACRHQGRRLSFVAASLGWPVHDGVHRGYGMLRAVLCMGRWPAVRRASSSACHTTATSAASSALAKTPCLPVPGFHSLTAGQAEQAVLCPQGSCGMPMEGGALLLW